MKTGRQHILILAPGLVAGMIAVGGAQASSIVAIEALDGQTSPSVISLEALPQGASGSMVAAPLHPDPTPSIVVLGEPAVADENVAAIPAASRRGPEPMVIRGGDVGEAFATPAPVTPQTPSAGIEEPDKDGEDETAEFDPTEPPREPPAAASPSPPTLLPQ